MKHSKRSAAVVALVIAASVLAEARVTSAAPGDDLTISVLTFGPGDHPFFKFGHNAILVQERSTGERGQTGWVYNFGTFAFDTAALIPKFLRGRFKYWLSVSSVEDTLQSYAAANRSIASQELDLTSAQKWALAQALRENARPENRAYLYDYFRDNCSTRVRDAVDRAVEGAVRKAGLSPGRGTYRSHALRMVADLWPEYVGIYLGLGRAADRPINRWEEAFLPDRLAALLRDVRIADPAGERPLVKAEKVLFLARRPAKPDAPPNWAGYFLGFGIALAILLAGLGRLAKRARWARVVLGIAVAGLAGVFGFLGLVMLGLWLLTDHKIAYANANILQFAPWMVALFGYGIGVALGRQRATRRARGLALAAAALALAGLGAKALPGLSQDNWPFIVMCLPVWLGMAAGLGWVGRKGA
jgi:hypothetical protein